MLFLPIRIKTQNKNVDSSTDSGLDTTYSDLITHYFTPETLTYMQSVMI